MTSVSDWSVAFCLTCDNQTQEGPYCSQSCRMADLERSHHTQSGSNPSTTTSSNSSPTQSQGLYIPPSVNFSNYQSSHSSSSSVATDYSQQQSSSSNYVLTYSDPEQARRSSPTDSENDLSLSYFTSRDSSRSPTSSFYTFPHNTPAVSERTRQQLQSYENSFDKVRHRKYRH